MKFCFLISSLLATADAWTSTNPFKGYAKSTSSLKSSSGDFNVVFRPSDNPDAFDNHKIGAARVHRYARDSDDSEAEYIM